MSPDFTERERVAWAAGIIEGEGSFYFGKHGIRIAVQMTDRDVLERLQEIFGGGIYKTNKQKEYYKDAWAWAIRGRMAVEVTEKIRPYLLSRRGERADGLCEWYKNNSFNSRLRKMREQIFLLRDRGLTHKEISEIIGKDRSTVSYVLEERYGGRSLWVRPLPVKQAKRVRISPTTPACKA